MAARRPDTPLLPWIGPDGQRISGFMVVPIPECSIGTTVVFMDANGSAVDVTNKGAMYRAAEALNPIIGELTLLPDRE
jgi:hypothetical protein